jgi:hypothetical protein
MYTCDQLTWERSCKLFPTQQSCNCRCWKQGWPLDKKVKPCLFTLLEEFFFLAELGVGLRPSTCTLPLEPLCQPKSIYFFLFVCFLFWAVLGFEHRVLYHLIHASFEENCLGPEGGIGCACNTMWQSRPHGFYGEGPLLWLLWTRKPDAIWRSGRTC